jgi:hypothetical protein
MIYKNVASQKALVFIYDINNNNPLTGYGPAVSGFVSRDGGAPSGLTTPNPIEITGGLYYYSLTQNETNGDVLGLISYSSSGNVAIDPLIFYTSAQIPSVNAIQIGSSTSAANNSASFFTTGYAASNSSLGAVGTVSGNLTVSGLYDANIVSISGSAISAKNLALFFNASGYAASGSVNKLNGRTPDNITFDNVWEILVGCAAGKVTGASSGASVINIRNYADTKNVVSLNVDAYGNRSSGVIA